jgi:hypothetical protein
VACKFGASPVTSRRKRSRVRVGVHARGADLAALANLPRRARIVPQRQRNLSSVPC